MTPRRHFQATAIAAIATLVLVTGLSASPAAASRGDHLAVLAGSSHDLVYADDPVFDGNVDYLHGELHVRSTNGHDRNLGGGFGNTDPAAADRYNFSLVGPNLTGYSLGDPSHVEWWDLATDTQGIGTLPAGATWQGSAPGGWLIVEADHATTAVQATTGAITSYGQPLPAEAGLGGSITAVSGPSGFLSVGEKSGGMAYERWDSPAAVTSLDPGVTGPVGVTCHDLSNVIAACTEPATTDQRAVHLAIPVDGSAPRSYPGCSADSVAIGPVLEWACGQQRSHPRFATGASKVKRSAVAVAPVDGVSALGTLVTVGPNQGEIIAIANSHSKSHVLVAIPSPIIQLDNASLRAAAQDVEAAALRSGALRAPAAYRFPAQVLLAASDALISAARAQDPGLAPQDTRSVMGPVPAAIKHHHLRPPHRHIRASHTLARFRHAVPDRGSGGLGMHATHGGSTPAPFRPVDGVYVDPKLQQPAHPTIGMVALRTALSRIGQPYVWAAGGPSTFDCSGLTQWAYAHAGLRLIHFTGSQWNQGRLLKPRQILPGDLLLFDRLVHHHHDIHHVGIYLGAGWMVNAPFTGQYVSVTQVPHGVAGAVRP
jgi:cell wall-associated NlpC family hydrolase